MRELERAGLVEYKEAHWRPTHLGRSAYRVHSAYLNRLESLLDASTVLEALPPDSRIDQEFLDDVMVDEPSQGVLNGVVMDLLEYAEAASDVRVMTPKVVAGFGGKFYQRALSGSEATFEMIAPTEVYEWLYSMDSLEVRKALDDPNANTLRASVPLSFALSIFDDDYATITVFSEQGIAGLLVNNTEQSLSWAEEQYALVRQDAVQISGR